VISNVIVHSFLKSLLGTSPRQPQPAHKTDVRLQLAQMVIDELPGDDLEELAHRGHAEAFRDVYLTPDPDRYDRYDEVLKAYLSVLQGPDETD
jgi:hypothetical protein